MEPRISINLTKWLGGIAAILIAALLMAQLGIVALRYVFAIGWPWALDFLVYMFLLAGLIPGVAVILTNMGVRVDIYYSNWKKPKQRWIDRIALLVLLFPAMGYSAWSMVAPVTKSWQLLESSPTIGGLPGYFILKTVLLLYFAGISVTALVLASRRNPYGSDDSAADQSGGIT